MADGGTATGNTDDGHGLRGLVTMVVKVDISVDETRRLRTTAPSEQDDQRDVAHDRSSVSVASRHGAVTTITANQRLLLRASAHHQSRHRNPSSKVLEAVFKRPEDGCRRLR